MLPSEESRPQESAAVSAAAPAVTHLSLLHGVEDGPGYTDGPPASDAANASRSNGRGTADTDEDLNAARSRRKIRCGPCAGGDSDGHHRLERVGFRNGDPFTNVRLRRLRPPRRLPPTRRRRQQAAVFQGSIGAGARRCLLATLRFDRPGEEPRRQETGRPSRRDRFLRLANGLPSAGGSLADPWDLQTAFDQPLPPGSTLWLRGGTYRKTFTCKLAGTASARITIKPYPGERVTFDSHDPANVNASLITTPAAAFLDFWDLEFTVSNVNRQNNGVPGATSGPAPGGNNAENTHGHDLRFIHLVVHDTTGGWGMNQDDAYNNEVWGLISFYNGWWGIDRAHGHNLYMHNKTGYKKAVNSILFDSFAEGNQVYTAGGFVNGIVQLGTVTFDSGKINSAQPQTIGIAAPRCGYPPDTPAALVGTYDTVQNSVCGSGNAAGDGTFDGNLEYFSGAREVGSNYAYGAGFNKLWLTGSYFAADGARESCGLKSTQLGAGRQNTITGNTFVGGSKAYAGAALMASTFPKNKYIDRTAGTPPDQIFYQRDALTPGRGNVIVYNWSSKSTVTADLSKVGLPTGQAFVVKHAIDFYGASVVSGTYSGGASVTLPMTNLPIQQPVNAVKPAGPFPRFAVFVVLPGPDKRAVATPASAGIAPSDHLRSSSRTQIR